MKWDENAEYVNNILDLTAGKLTVVIGTVFKEQRKKPCVFEDISGVIKASHYPVDLSFGHNAENGSEDLRGHYTAEDDHIILEDASGRINIRAGDALKPDELITGTIMALLGCSDNQGYFCVQDKCLAGIPFEPELPPSVEIKNRGLFNDELLQKGARKFIAITSGLNFGHMGDENDCNDAMFLLASFLKGQHLNAKMNKVAA